MKPIYISYATLVRLGACEEREEFRKRFGSTKVLVTVTTAIANADWANWPWLRETLLTVDNRIALGERLNAEFKGDFCTCVECDPYGAKRRIIAKFTAEAFLAQGGYANNKDGL